MSTDSTGKHPADERAHHPTCPFCGADDAEMLSLFGSQLLTEQYYCRACHTPFERVKDDDAAPPAVQTTTDPAR